MSQARCPAYWAPSLHRQCNTKQLSFVRSIGRSSDHTPSKSTPQDMAKEPTQLSVDRPHVLVTVSGARSPGAESSDTHPPRLNRASLSLTPFDSSPVLVLLELRTAVRLRSFDASHTPGEFMNGVYFIPPRLYDRQCPDRWLPGYYSAAYVVRQEVADLSSIRWLKVPMHVKAGEQQRGATSMKVGPATWRNITAA